MKGSSVYVNGKLVGFHQEPEKLVNAIKGMRRDGKLPPDLSVAYYSDTDEVYINMDAGRAMRPLLVVKDGKPLLTEEHINQIHEGLLTWNDLVRKGIIEYLDAEEEENAYIAMSIDELTPEHTHLEIHPALILGIVASVVPFANHNSAPRLTMATAMLKQSLGVYSSNFNYRMDTQMHILYQPQIPIVQTKQTKYIGLNDRPAGQNAIVAITPYYGYTIHDAIVINKASIERGLFRSVFFRTYTDEERKYPGGQKDRFEIPKPEIFGYRGDEAYKHLGEDGLAFPGREVKGGDVIIGKTSPPRFIEEVGELSLLEEKRRENSVIVRKGEGGVVDSVMLTETDGGNKLVKVRVRSVKIPEIGDKFASRYGQKGVIGLIVPQWDMPFTADGITPDIIMDPHAVPSRMTVGHILELLGAKAGSLSCKLVNGTAFEKPNLDWMREVLKSYGFRPDGKEVLYDGMTGEKVKAEIFMGPIYYQKLKHLVSLKIHARSRGPVQILTRQPTEGRAREGGLKFGEMERDTLIGHGASMLLQERLLKESDEIEVPVCKKCGVVAIEDHIKGKAYCPVCGGTDIYKIKTSYAFKLLLSEMMAMGIYPKLKLKDKA